MYLRGREPLGVRTVYRGTRTSTGGKRYMASTPLRACTTGTHHDTAQGWKGHRRLTDVQEPCSLLMHMRCRWVENRGNLREAETRNPARR